MGGKKFVYLTRTVALIVALPSRVRRYPATWLSQIPGFEYTVEALIT